MKAEEDQNGDHHDDASDQQGARIHWDPGTVPAMGCVYPG